MSLSKIDYETDVVYQYKNDSFIEKELFNKRLLIDKYTQLLHCKKPFFRRRLPLLQLQFMQRGNRGDFPQKSRFCKIEF